MAGLKRDGSRSCWCVCVLAALIVPSPTHAAPNASPEIVSAHYSADQVFPEFLDQWQETYAFADGTGDPENYVRREIPLGGYAYVYLRNRTNAPMKVSDLRLEGVKLSEALGQTAYPERPDERYQSSVVLSKLPKQNIDKLKAAGTPVWWKYEPSEVPAGGIGEIVLRLRRNPTIQKLQLGILTDNREIQVSVLVNRVQPKFQSISFTPDLNAVYLYIRYPQKNDVRPDKVLIDDQDVTALCQIGHDAAVEVSPIVINLQKPLKWMSFHVFKAVYPDGSAAVSGIRAWGHDMVYGMWATAGDIGRTEDSARARVNDWNTHNLNAIMGMYSGDNDFFFGDKGWEFTESLGIGRMTHWIVDGQRPLYLFLMDEPDASDAFSEKLPATDRLGGNGQWLVKWADVLHRKQPDSPVLLNIDNTYKPENWYTYHQIPDIPCIDPYYQSELDHAYKKHPGSLGAHTKPTYVYGASCISESSCAPKPLHVILCSTKYVDSSYASRYPTPEEKRMEVYYAVAGGAKGLSYWWFSKDSRCQGCGADDPDAKALYREIGLLGAEVRTEGPIVTTSCPAELLIRAHSHLWVRSLISGLDTAAVIVVNNDVACDRLGTVARPVEKAWVTVTPPSWLKPKDLFEVTSDGIKDITWKPDGSDVALTFDRVDISRFIVLTADPGLRKQLQDLYETKFAGNIKALTAVDGK